MDGRRFGHYDELATPIAKPWTLKNRGLCQQQGLSVFKLPQKLFGGEFVACRAARAAKSG
jgi:hypothetical protein